MKRFRSQPETTTAASPRRLHLDIAFVVSVTGTYVGFQALPAQRVVFGVMGAALVLRFLALEWRGGFRSPREVGLRVDNLRPSFVTAIAVLGPLLAVAVIYASLHGVYRPAHFVIALAVYPLWGLVQQVALQGLCLQAFQRLHRPVWGLVVTSLLFALAHFPSRFLMLFTAAGAPLFSLLYLRRPNVLPLALFHGVFGAFLYYVFRQKDVVGSLLGTQ